MNGYNPNDEFWITDKDKRGSGRQENPRPGFCDYCQTKMPSRAEWKRHLRSTPCGELRKAALARQKIISLEERGRLRSSGGVRGAGNHKTTLYVAAGARRSGPGTRMG